jgi:hypothetical protein
MHQWPSDWSLVAGLERMGSTAALARALKLPDSTVRDRLDKAKGVVEGRTCMDFILTSAQISTDVHKGFIENLHAACRFYNAQLIAAGITYNVDEGYGHGDAKNKDKGHLYAPEIRAFLTNTQTRLNDNMVFTGELNILPTAKRPLTGLEGYTGCDSTIVPHPKRQVKCVATRAGQLAKQMWTTGSCTVPNYIQKKAGQLGERHHTLGAVIVRVVDSKIAHIRALSADSETGAFYDLTNKFEDGRVTTGHRVNGIVYGDIHEEKRDIKVGRATWGYIGKRQAPIPNNLLDLLKPAHQYFHDLSDFAPRNHHNIRDPRWMARHCHESVEDALADCAYFLQHTYRDWCTSVIVESNHDQAFQKWLDTADIKVEPNPRNVEFYHRCQQMVYEALLKKNDYFCIFEKILTLHMRRCENMKFLRVDESYVRVGIEHSFHGHNGINGSRGSVLQYSKLGPKTSSGHTHTPETFEGAMCAGVSARLNQGYNVGPGSWFQTHIIEYEDGHRTHINIINGSCFKEIPAEATL